MNCARLGIVVLFGAATVACNLQNHSNANSRYTVEKVEILRVSESKLPRELREDLHKMVGRKYSHEAFSELAVRIQRELHATAVTENMHRGTQRGRVIVILTVVPGRLWKYYADPQQFLAVGGRYSAILPRAGIRGRSTQSPISRSA